MNKYGKQSLNAAVFSDVNFLMGVPSRGQRLAPTKMRRLHVCNRCEQQIFLKFRTERAAIGRFAPTSLRLPRPDCSHRM